MITGIKLDEARSSKLADTLTVTSEPLAGFAKTVSKGLETELYKLNAHSRDDLAVSLHNKIAFSKKAFQRNKSRSGRVVNWLLREKEPAYIEISGVELSALLGFLNETADIQIENNLVYLVPFETTELLLRRLS